MKPIFPSPGGGMTLERIPEIANFFGNDTFLLIGGALHRGNLLGNAKSLRTYVETLEN
jgi:ribulose-bisphosphate carboxylase large chain